MKYQGRPTRRVTSEPTIDQLIRHLQAELDLVHEIVDAQAKEQRQWQIECTIQESLAFLQKVKDREHAGMRRILIEKEPVRVLKSTSNTDAEEGKEDSDTDGVRCPNCEGVMDAGLDFCQSCGELR